MFKRRRFLKKLKTYWNEWDTERHGRTKVLKDGRLIPTNNIDLGEICLTKGDMARLIQIIENNT